MKTLAQKLAEIANSGLRGKELQMALEKEIAKIRPYEHDEDNPMEACGIKSDLAFSLEGAGRLSEIVEKIEKSLPKRELSFVLFKILTEKGDLSRGSHISKAKDSSSDSSIDPADFYGRLMS